MKNQFEFMRPAEIVEEKKRCPLVYLPLGPLEWHGPHLPMGVDPLNAKAAALRCAEITGGVVLPTLFMGTERERSPQMLKNIGFDEDEWVVGMDFPENSIESLYFSEELFTICLRGWLDLLVEQGYKLIVIMNGHGAENQSVALQRITAEYNHKGPARVVFYMPMPGFIAKTSSWAHATADETSVMMDVHPESVDLTTLPEKEQPLYNKDWAIVDNLTFRGEPTEDFTVREDDDPRLTSSVEKGRKHLQAAVAEIVEAVKKELKRM